MSAAVTTLSCVYVAKSDPSHAGQSVRKLEETGSIPTFWRLWLSQVRTWTQHSTVSLWSQWSTL